MGESILAILIIAAILLLWIYVVPSCPPAYGPEEEDHGLITLTTVSLDEIAIPITDNLICIGGPLDGQFVDIPRSWPVIQVPDWEPEVPPYIGPESVPEDPTLDITTYLRGEIVFPLRGEGGCSYKYLYAQELDKYLSGIRASHILGHRSKIR